jgi:DNA-binding CsgD family transcriptional regulator
MCDKCPKRDSCRRICEEVEDILSGLNHKQKTNYLIKFVDPFVLEDVAKERWFVEKHTSVKRKKLYRVLDKRIGRLTKVQKICVCYYYGLRGESSISQYEIAKILHISQNTVAYHLKKAREKLREKVGKFV